MSICAADILMGGEDQRLLTSSPTIQEGLKAPFPWFGGKRRCARLVWERFGPVPNFVEPFAGSLAVLLARTTTAKTETINDLNCYVANFWRALQADPRAVAEFADWPINEADLHARHLWLTQQTEFRERMKSEPEFYDARVAGWWVWGICQWIGSGWCEKPTWRRSAIGRNGRGIWRKKPQFKRGHGSGVLRQSPGRKLPSLSGDGSGSSRGLLSNGHAEDLFAYMESLAERLRKVRVTCGEWKRITSPSVTTCVGLTGVFLDPPYGCADRDSSIYGEEDGLTVAGDVREWCRVSGANDQLRIALCGYEGEHNALEELGWTKVAWKANGGYGNQQGGRGAANAQRERIWFSPRCLSAEQQGELVLADGRKEINE